MKNVSETNKILIRFYTTKQDLTLKLTVSLKHFKIKHPIVFFPKLNEPIP